MKSKDKHIQCRPCFSCSPSAGSRSEVRCCCELHRAQFAALHTGEGFISPSIIIRLLFPFLFRPGECCSNATGVLQQIDDLLSSEQNNFRIHSAAQRPAHQPTNSNRNAAGKCRQQQRHSLRAQVITCSIPSSDHNYCCALNRNKNTNDNRPLSVEYLS